jgi:hypothetical protein
MFQARVHRVLVASPSDTLDARRALRVAIEDWSSLNAEDSGVDLMPLLWERDSHPEMGDRPQGVINRQLGDRCDLVVGTFWTRVGTPTGEADSGSVEEVERAIEQGKPVLLYFSATPVIPDNLDEDQWARLKAFRARVEEQGLVDTYANTEELTRKVSAALTRIVRDRLGGEIAEATPVRPRAQLVARIDREPRIRTSGGRVSQSNDYALIIENVGTAPAEDVSFEIVADDKEREDMSVPEVLDAGSPVPRLVPGNPLRYYLVVVLGTRSQFEIELRWREGDQPHSERQTLRW